MAILADDDEIEITARPSRTADRPVGTEQQEDFWRVITDTSDHARLTARAGTGKSFSIREGIWRRLEQNPGERLTYVAFNRSIADDFQQGLPRGAVASTMHSAGYRACMQTFPGLGEVDEKKPWRHASEIIRGWGTEARKARSATVRLAALVKNYHLFNTDERYIDETVITRLSAAHGIVVPPKFRYLVTDGVTELLNRCIDDTSCIDYDDMVWFPVVLGLDFEPADVLFVDEAQDLSPLQHKMILGMAPRIVFVGDDRQAIYAFRGADSSSMDTLDDVLSNDPTRDLYALPLTLTRRCPQSHVAIARGIVPDFGCLPGAPEGIVDVNHSGDDIGPGWMVLCRTNAPLLGAAFSFAAAGVPVYVQGRDVGKQLARFAESLDARDSADLGHKARAHLARELARLAEIDGSEAEASALQDQCMCIEAATAWGESVDDVIDGIKRIFIDAKKSEQGSYVLLSSIHRAKGREADNVAILEPGLMPHKMSRTPESHKQESNLAYVAATRSKHRLSFLDSIPAIYDRGE